MGEAAAVFAAALQRLNGAEVAPLPTGERDIGRWVPLHRCYIIFVFFVHLLFTAKHKYKV